MNEITVELINSWLKLRPIMGVTDSHISNELDD